MNGLTTFRQHDLTFRENIALSRAAQISCPAFHRSHQVLVSFSCKLGPESPIQAECFRPTIVIIWIILANWDVVLKRNVAIEGFL